MVRGIVLLGVAVAPTGRVAAQEAGRAEGQKPPAGCFRGGPLPACRSFWITEASYLIRLPAAPRIRTRTASAAGTPRRSISEGC